MKVAKFATKKEAEAYRRKNGGYIVTCENKANRSGKTYVVIIETSRAEALAEVDEPFKMQYLVCARMRKDTKFFTVAGLPSRPIKDLATARYELQAAKARAEREIRNKRRAPMQAGCFAVETEYHSDYDLVEFEIVARKATAWKTIESVKTEE